MEVPRNGDFGKLTLGKGPRWLPPRTLLLRATAWVEQAIDIQSAASTDKIYDRPQSSEWRKRTVISARSRALCCSLSYSSCVMSLASYACSAAGLSMCASFHSFVDTTHSRVLRPIGRNDRCCPWRRHSRRYSLRHQQPILNRKVACHITSISKEDMLVPIRRSSIRILNLDGLHNLAVGSFLKLPQLVTVEQVQLALLPRDNQQMRMRPRLRWKQHRSPGSRGPNPSRPAPSD